MDRSDGKPLINRPVADGIRKQKNYQLGALSRRSEAHRAKHGVLHSPNKQSLGGALYKHLMSGASQMLPFVTGGGTRLPCSLD